jgi:hypothetical protein
MYVHRLDILLQGQSLLGATEPSKLHLSPLVSLNL